MKIGIIGAGFVGSAVENAYLINGITPVVHDPGKKLVKSKSDINQCDAIFICVPSPSASNGRCDTSSLEAVLFSIRDFQGVIISKVTAPPTCYKRLQELHPNLVHAPEFLVAASAKADYINSKFCFIGGNEEWCQKAETVIRLGQTHLDTVKYSTIQEAALAKYTINCFLATKVAFMNGLYEVTQKLDINYDSVIELVKCDTRIGSSHLNVPGPDGQFGFGGACFPKDTSALAYTASELGIDFEVLNSVIKYNTRIRNNS